MTIRFRSLPTRAVLALAAVGGLLSACVAGEDAPGGGTGG